MRAIKFDPEFHIPLAEKYAREGLIDENIAKKLGIGRTTFYKWKRDYPSFANALKVSKDVVDFEVENALLKRALGYELEETKTKILAVKTITRHGETIEQHPVIIEKTRKFIPPDVTACIFWLKNRDRDHWRDKPDISEVCTRHPLQDVTETIAADMEFYKVTYIDPVKNDTDTQES